MQYLSIAQRRWATQDVQPLDPESVQLAIEKELCAGFTHAMNNKQLAAYHAFLSVAENPQAEQEHSAVAHYEVGIRLREGRGVARNDELAFEWLSKAAVQGNPRAQLELGKMYALGVGVAKNYAEAIAQFKAAKTPQALCELGKLFALGYGDATDYGEKTHYEAAVVCFNQAFDEGVPEAGYELGRMYYFGCGVQQDFNEAFKLFQAAAELGVPDALFGLGKMYEDGKGVPQDKTIALEKYQAAAALGSARAMHNLGDMYRLGRSVPQDYSTAVKYYDQSGSSASLNNLAIMYENGQGVEKNAQTAVEKYQTAAQRSTQALFNLGIMYREGHGVAQDYSAAIDCFRRAAELGDEDAWDALEEMHNKGEGYVGDYQAARLYYEKAHQQGLPRAGEGYDNGYGGDYSVILSYYRAAANENDPRAFYNLGMLYLEGRGVDKNLTRALAYLEQAAQLHDLEAKRQLAKLLKTSPSDVVNCYQVAAKNNESWAQLALGKLYALGAGVAKNYAKAITHFKAAKTPQALCELGKLLALGYGDETDYGGRTHYEAAVVCFNQALDEGVPEAGCELGKMYFYGCGVKTDFNKAFTLIQAAAQRGVPEASYFLGWMYEKGKGVDQNDVDAVKNYQTAAVLGSAKAMHNLGDMYRLGQGVPQDYSTAVKYYDQSGHAASLNNLATMYENGQGVEKNAQTAVEKYQAAAALGEPIALVNLGRVYRDGGVAQDYSAAIGCFRRAAELGNENAWNALKGMQDKNQGDVGDYEAARKYYEEAHKQGLLRVEDRNRNEYGDDCSTILRYYRAAAKRDDSRAFYNLGMLHSEGRGVEKNLEIAVNYLEQAEQKNDAQAKRQLDKWLKSNNDEMQSQVLAVYLEAAKKNKTWALLGLGKLYLEENSLVPQDRLTGWRYLETLIDMNESKSLSVADKARIKEAGEFLGKLKFSPKHFSITSGLAQEPKIRAFHDDNGL